MAKHKNHKEQESVCFLFLQRGISKFLVFWVTRNLKPVTSITGSDLKLCLK